MGSLLIALSWLAACEGATGGGAIGTATQEVSATPATQVAARAQGATEEPQAVQAARGALAAELQVDPDEIRVVSLEPVEWPDSCLGVYKADQACARQGVPGYRLVLAVAGERYELHSDETGRVVEGVPGPMLPSDGLNLVWQEGEQCEVVTMVVGQGVRSGPCDAPAAETRFAGEGEPEELERFTASYAPFYAETAAGRLRFVGEGDRLASPAERRRIAEWARLAAEEASAGRTSVGFGLAIGWHREGGFAGFCDDLAVYVTGAVVASSCKGEPVDREARDELTVEQLEQLYAWVDGLKPFELTRTDSAVADAMTVRLAFNGRGEAEADEVEKAAIAAFAGEVYEQAKGE